MGKQVIRITHGTGTQIQLFEFYKKWIDKLYLGILAMKVTQKLIKKDPVRYNQFFANLRTFYETKVDLYSREVNIVKEKYSQNDMGLAKIVADMGVECKLYYQDYFGILKEAQLWEEYRKENRDSTLELASIGEFVNSYHI